MANGDVHRITEGLEYDIIDKKNKMILLSFKTMETADIVKKRIENTPECKQ